MMSGDNRGRVPFAFVAVTLLLLSGVSTAFLAGVNHDYVLSNIQNQEINKMDAIADSVQAEIAAHAYTLSSDAIFKVTQATPYDVEKINEYFHQNSNGLFDIYIATSFPRLIGGYSIKVESYDVIIVMCEKDTYDLTAQTKNMTEPSRTGEGDYLVIDTTKGREMNDTSSLVYYSITGSVNITIIKKETNFQYKKTLEFDRELRCPFPFLQNKMTILKENSEGDTTEIARVVKYILTTVAQYRVLQGYGMNDIVNSTSPQPGIVNGYEGRDNILTEDDVEIAVNLAVLLEISRLYRTYDNDSLTELDDRFSGLTRRMRELLTEYMTTGTIDAADVVAIFNGYAVDDEGRYQNPTPLNLEAIIAQALNAIVDQFILKYFEAFHLMPALDAVYYGVQELADITDNIMDWFIRESSEPNLTLIHRFVKDTFSDAGLTNTSFVQPGGWPHNTFEGEQIVGYPQTPSPWSLSYDLKYRVRETAPGGNSGNEWWLYSCGHGGIHRGNQPHCTVSVPVDTDSEGNTIYGPCGREDFLWGYDYQDYSLRVTLNAPSHELPFFSKDILTSSNAGIWGQFYEELSNNTEQTKENLKTAVQKIITQLVRQLMSHPNLERLLNEERTLIVDPKDNVALLEDIQVNVGEAIDGVLTHFINTPDDLINTITDENPVDEYVYDDMKGHILSLRKFIINNYDDLVHKDELILAVAREFANHLTKPANNHFSYSIISAGADTPREMSTVCDKPIQSEVTSNSFLSGVTHEDVALVFRNGGAIQSPLLPKLVNDLKDGVVLAGYVIIREREVTNFDTSEQWSEDTDGVIIQALEFYMYEDVPGSRSIQSTNNHGGTRSIPAYGSSFMVYEDVHLNSYDNYPPHTITCSIVPTITDATSITISWAAEDDHDLEAIRLYYKKDSGSYSQCDSTTIGGTADILETGAFSFIFTSYGGPGSYSFYAVASDNDSAISQSAIDSVIYDDTPPYATVISPTNTMPTNLATVQIQYLYGEGATSVGIYYSINNGSTWSLLSTDSSVDGTILISMPPLGNPYVDICWNARAFGWKDESTPSGVGSVEKSYYYYDNIKPRIIAYETLSTVDGKATTDTQIKITFSETVKIAPFNIAYTPTSPSLSFIVEWDVEHKIATVKLESASYYQRESNYKLVFLVNDPANNAIDISYDEVIFTTIPWPRVFLQAPVDGTLNVDLGECVVISFDERMTNTDIASNIISSVPSIAGWSISWQGAGPSSGLTAVFTHAEVFDDSTLYSLTIDLDKFKSVEHPDGSIPLDEEAPINNKLEWEMTTIDTTNPIILSTLPAADGVNVGPNQDITITFSEAVTNCDVYINEASTGLFLHHESNPMSSTLIVTHSAFHEGKTYSVYVSAYDPTGNPLSASIQNPWSFTVIDITPPALMSHSPGNNAINVPTDSMVLFTFSESIQVGTLVYHVSPDPGGWTENWNSDGTMLFLSHNKYAADTRYTVTVTGFMDVAGNPGASSVFTYQTSLNENGGIATGLENKVWESIVGGIYGMGANALFPLMGSYVKTVCSDIIYGGRVANTKYVQDVYYMNPGSTSPIPFVFNDNASDAMPDIEKILLNQTPDWLEPQIIIGEPFGVHYVNVLQFSTRPYETLWNVSIDCEFKLDTKTASKIFKVNGTHAETWHNGTISLDMAIPITVYSGWGLTDVDYDLNGDIDDLLEAFMRFLNLVWDKLCDVLNWMLDGFFKIIELLSDFTIKIFEMGATLIEIISEVIKTVNNLIENAVQYISGVVVNAIIGALDFLGMSELKLVVFGLFIQINKINSKKLDVSFKHDFGRASHIIRFSKEGNDGNIQAYSSIELGDLRCMLHLDYVSPYTTLDTSEPLDSPFRVVANFGNEYEMVIDHLETELKTTAEVSFKVTAAPFPVVVGVGARVHLKTTQLLDSTSELIEFTADINEAMTDIIMESFGALFSESESNGEGSGLFNLYEFNNKNVALFQNLNDELVPRFNEILGEFSKDTTIEFYIKIGPGVGVEAGGNGGELSWGIELAFIVKDPLVTLGAFLRWIINDFSGIMQTIFEQMIVGLAISAAFIICPPAMLFSSASLVLSLMNRMEPIVLEKIFFKFSLIGTVAGSFGVGLEGKAGAFISFNGPSLLILYPWSWNEYKGKPRIEFGLYLRGDVIMSPGIKLKQSTIVWLVKGEIYELE